MVNVIRAFPGPQFLISVILLVSCAKTMPVEMPAPPSMAALVGAYESPSAPLTAETIPQLIESVTETIEVFDQSGQLTFLFEMLGAIGSSTSTGSAGSGSTQQSLSTYTMNGNGLTQRSQPLVVGGTTIEGEGFMRIRRICTGWGTDPLIDEGANGWIDLTSTFDDNGLGSVVWGQISGCKYEFEETRVRLEADVNLHLGETPDLTQLESMAVLIQLTGELDLDSELVSAPADLRLSLDGLLELRIPVELGEVVFFSSTSAMGFRAANGRWNCDWDVAQCMDEIGNSIAW